MIIGVFMVTSSSSDVSAASAAATVSYTATSSASATREIVGVPEKDPTEVAMNAIQTTLAISGWTIGVLGLLIAAIAIFGWSSIKGGAKRDVEQIANASWRDYIQSDEFKELIKSGVDESVALRWQDNVVAKNLTEDQKNDDDHGPFEKGGEG